MSRQGDLEKAEKDIKETELKLHKIKATLKDIQDEIDKLHLLEVTLVENLAFLKTSGAAVKATEYRKAKEGLVRTRGRLSMIRIDRDNISKAQMDCESYIKKARDVITNALIGKDNVLSFKKRKTDGS